MTSPKRSGLTALVVAALLASASTAKAPLTTPACLAKKLKAWGNLRRCQDIENGKVLEQKPAAPEACQTTFNNALTKIDAQATAAAIACRYGVNGDGTATDYDTGLQWEQKENPDPFLNPADPHHANYEYSWCAGPFPLGNCTNLSNPPDGTAFTDFLGTLNNGTSSDKVAISGCFAGHCDWRLPSIVELEGIVDLNAPGCSTLPITGPCIDQTVFGPTVLSTAPDGHPVVPYWSATSEAGDQSSEVWVVDFSNGVVFDDFKLFYNLVRAVRSAL
jgi:hypothetical protein